jgi:hypothetical protein
MEKFETGTTTVAVEGGAEKVGYSREVTEMMAMEDALDRLDGAILLPTAEKIKELKKLIDELSATEEGGIIPLHNEHRHVVEALSKLLRVEEQQLQLDLVKKNYPEIAKQETV